MELASGLKEHLKFSMRKNVSETNIAGQRFLKLLHELWVGITLSLLTLQTWTAIKGVAASCYRSSVKHPLLHSVTELSYIIWTV